MSANAVVVCSWGSASDVEEVLTLGRSVSAAAGAELVWLILGSASPESAAIAGRYGVARVQQIEDPKLAGFPADACVASLAEYCRKRSPQLLLLSQSFDVRVVAPRVAGRLGYGVVMNAVGIEVEAGAFRVTASAYGGDTRVVYTLGGATSHVVSLLANAVIPEPGEAAAPGPGPGPEAVAVDLAAVEERIRVVEAAKTEGPRLEDAEIIVSGGRGLGGPENFKLIEQLAEALGGMAGASRPIVDEGWVDASRQVGLTGRITRPTLYLAAGISGASQHMAGCSAAKTIVAINRDSDAAIFRYARYGIVGDCLEILPELIRVAENKN